MCETGYKCTQARHTMNTQHRSNLNLFIPKEGREDIDKTQGEIEKLVTKSVMQGKCISIPHIHSTPWEPV